MYERFFLILGLILLTCTLWNFGCATLPDVAPQSQSFLLPYSFENYQSSGRILLATAEQKYAGELEFSLSKYFELRLQIFTPVLGTLLYEIRANPARFMILDFQNQQYALEKNISQIRRQWLGMDISLEELSWAISGRMPRQRYQTFQGQSLSQKTRKFQFRGAEFFVILGEHGILKQMTKTFKGKREYRVTVQEYQSIASQIYPQKIQIVHLQNRDRILLVMNEISPQMAQLPPLVFLPVEGMVPYRYESQ